MTVAHEKYLSTQNKAVKRNKKKNHENSVNNSVYVPNDKERVEILSTIVNRLKLELNTIDAAIGKIFKNVITIFALI